MVFAYFGLYSLVVGLSVVCYCDGNKGKFVNKYMMNARVFTIRIFFFASSL